MKPRTVQLIPCDAVEGFGGGGGRSYRKQSEIDREKAKQTQKAQVAELMGRQQEGTQQQQVNSPLQGNPPLQENHLAQSNPQRQAHRQQVYQQQQSPDTQQQPTLLLSTVWQQDQAGHTYRKVYDNSTQQWYTQWWDEEQSRPYRVLTDAHGQNYSEWE